MTRGRQLRACLLASCLALSSVIAPRRAAAQPSAEDQALATTLFREAKALLDAEKVPEACRKLGESQRLFPAGGTLLNLAVCHEKEGKTATAWAEYREARVIAERDQRDDRIQLVDERLKLLEPKLSKLVIEITPGAVVAEMEVMVDERAVRAAAWGTQMPVDPGEHTIEARARGKKSWRTQVILLPDADLKTVAVPAWEDEAPAAPTTPSTPAPARTEPAPPPRPARNRTPALVVGIGAIAAVGVGTFFGVRAITKHDDSVDACRTNPCSSESITANDSAKTAADISTVAFAVGLVGLGVSAYLWFFAGSGATARTFRVGPGQVAGTF